MKLPNQLTMTLSAHDLRKASHGASLRLACGSPAESEQQEPRRPAPRTARRAGSRARSSQGCLSFAPHTLALASRGLSALQMHLLRPRLGYVSVHSKSTHIGTIKYEGGRNEQACCAEQSEGFERCSIDVGFHRIESSLCDGNHCNISNQDPWGDRPCGALISRPNEMRAIQIAR